MFFLWSLPQKNVSNHYPQIFYLNWKRLGTFFWGNEQSEKKSDIKNQDTFRLRNLSLRMKWQMCTVDLQLSINACCSQQKLVKNAQKISGYSEHVADKCHVTLSFSHCKCQSILTFSFFRHANVQSRDLKKRKLLYTEGQANSNKNWRLWKRLPHHIGS